MIQGIIFDMDGLMIDTESLAVRFWNEAADAMCEPRAGSLIEKCFGLTDELIYQTIGNELPGFDARKFYDTALRMREIHMRKNGVKTMKGLFDLFDYISSKKIKSAVATSSGRSRVDFYFSSCGITHQFDAIVTGDMVRNSKPHPEPFLIASEKLNLCPSECMVLEDSHNGVRAGAAGGFVTVMIPDMMKVTDEMRGLFNFECKSLFEVPELIEKMNCSLMD